jgi:hypothetical protein
VDKKKAGRNLTDDLKGFEDFLEHVDSDNAVDKVNKNIGGESLTFLQHDNVRLKKVASLVAARLPVTRDHDQGPVIIEQQRQQNNRLRNELFRMLDKPASPLQKSLRDLWDGFFVDQKK